MNGVIDLDDSSSDEEVASEAKPQNNDKADFSDTFGFKKEETSEEKIIMDDITLNSGDPESESNLFPSEPNDQFPFNLDDKDKLPESILEETTNIFEELDKDSTQQEVDDSSRTERSEMDDIANLVAESEFAVQNSNNDNDVHETDGSGNGEGVDQLDREECSEQVSKQIDADDAETSMDAPTPKATDGVESESYPEDNIQPDDNDNEKEGGKDKDGESETIEKRPLSRDSTTSTTSSSSERITIRSTSQLNQLVSSNADIKIKTEKETTDKIEKPGLSVLNPSQLGAPDNTSGENLLQSGNFVTGGDQMLGFPPTVCSSQCDVCELQFTDTISLDDHRALAGHYKCVYAPECANFIFPTLAEFSAHQQSIHGMVNPSPVQQLAHQVQSLPMRYQMDQVGVPNNYQAPPGYPMPGQPNRSMASPMMGPAQQNNAPVRQYNVAGPPRTGNVRSVLPPPQMNPLKRGSPYQQPPPRQLAIPPKRSRMDNFQSRNGDTDCKFVSVQKPDNTDDVVAQLSKSITITARQETLKKNDTAAVANMLANRGITVSSVPTKTNKNNPVAMLNLNSAVSLIPTNANSAPNRQNSGFAVPQSRIGSGRQSLPGQVSQTVDLTGPEPRNRGLVNRTANSKFTCRICDRPFYNQDQLNQHMQIHRSGPKKLPFKCPNCPLQCQTQQALLQHRQVCRRDVVSGTNEMVIPIVDLKQPGALQKLQTIGINHMIPLNALGSQAANGTFGIPILAFSSDRVTNVNTANAGISNILPVGPLRRL